MPNSFSFGRFDLAPTNGSGPDAITAATTALATATALTGAMNVLTTDTGQTAVRLPEKHPVGSPIVVVTASATAALVFPPTAAGKINNGSAGASFSVAQNKPTLFFAHPNGVDYTAVLSA